jgi:hypothetical protein
MFRRPDLKEKPVFLCSSYIYSPYRIHKNRDPIYLGRNVNASRDTAQFSLNATITAVPTQIEKTRPSSNAHADQLFS